METPFGAREQGVFDLSFFNTHRFRIAFFIQKVTFENSRVAAPTFWKRVGGFHENCLRLARRCLLEIKAVSASRVVFVARSFSKMLGTPKGRGISTEIPERVRGCFSLVTFFLQKKKKGRSMPPTKSCRATPGSVAKSHSQANKHPTPSLRSVRSTTDAQFYDQTLIPN